MGKFFLVCFSAKGDVIKCAVLWNLWVQCNFILL
jgi:hypothetical protein